MLIRTNGNCLNWDVVAYLPQVCIDCGVEELRRTLDGENEDLDDCTVVKQEGKREPIIYQCRNGDKIDMSTWPKSHLDFIKRAYWMYLQNPPVEQFGEMFWQEPLGSYAGRPGLREIPLARVFMDLETRLSIKQGKCTPTFDSPIEPDWPL